MATAMGGSDAARCDDAGAGTSPQRASGRGPGSAPLRHAGHGTVTRLAAVSLLVVVAGLSLAGLYAHDLPPVGGAHAQADGLEQGGAGGATAESAGHAVADHVVINEVDTNPPGRDYATAVEWVELYNPTRSPVDIGGWEVASTTGQKKALVIPAGKTINPGEFVTLQHQKLWFSDKNEAIHLRDMSGTVVDSTVLITDTHDDMRSWQRIYDAHVNPGDPTSAWKFALATVGSSNGKSAQQDGAGPLEIVITTDRESYEFGQTATISGNVSERKFMERPFHAPHTIVIDVAGPGYRDTITLYPDPHLRFETTVSLQPAAGILKGAYNVSATYADTAAEVTFMVDEKQPEARADPDNPISIASDAPRYAPGQWVTITGATEEDAQFAVFAITVVDSGGATVFTGNPAPVNGAFETSFLLSAVNPSYGTHTITAEYAGKTAEHTFEVTTGSDAAASGESLIDLRTDRQSYIQNEVVAFSGHVRDIKPGTTSEFTTIGTAVVSISITDEDGRYLKRSVSQSDPNRNYNQGGHDGYTANAALDGSGSYESEIRLHPTLFAEGNYTATATYLGHKAMVKFSVAQKVAVDALTMSAEREVYGLGDTVRVSGETPATGANHASITVVRPDGATIRTTAPLVDHRFSIEWTVPKEGGLHTSKEGRLRGSELTMLGVYKVVASVEGHSGAAYLKLSDDPQNDSLAKSPLLVTLSKSVYQAGDDLVVSGEVLPLAQRGAGAASGVPSLAGSEASGENVQAPTRVQIVVKEDSFPFGQIYESWLYPDSGGSFHASFDLPIGVFRDGPYKVTAKYGPTMSTASFAVTNDYVSGGGGSASISISTDSASYEPGQTVTITGGPNKIIHIKEYVVSLFKLTGDEVDCGTVTCGHHKGDTVKVESDSAAGFTHQFLIPDGADAAGTYEVTVESAIGVERATFDVTAPEPPLPAQPKIIIDRQNRLPGSEFEIGTYAGTELHDEGRTVTGSPVSITGSVITALGSELDVNMRVSTEDGTCIIGQAAGCRISESAAVRGKVYDVVDISNDASITVVYNGAGERVERFTIFPGEGQDYLPDMTWNVSIIKDDQVSRFYYKVTYQTVQAE